MKTRISRILLAGSLMAALMMPTACTTTSTGQKVPDPIVMSAIAQNAAAIGTTLWLQSHPQDRQSFELARLSLKGLIAAGNGSPADLQAVLSSLPIKQLQGQSGAIAVSSAVVILDAAGKELMKLDTKQVWSGYVLPVAQGALAGLDQALGPATK